MACRERGMALASVLFILALLMLLALVLTDKVQQTTRATAMARRHARNLDAASAGIAWARRQLAIGYASSGNWHDFLATAPDTGHYPDTPTFSLEFDGRSVELFVHDNPDGDNNWQQDNDLQLYLLAHLPAEPGPETIIEVLCGFAADTASENYQQLQSGVLQTGAGAEPGPASDFQLTD